MKCKNMACFWARSPATVRGLLSCQPQLLQWGVQTALHAPLCHFECLSLSFSLSHSPCLSVSPGLSTQRHSAMMGFSDGIKMSLPTAVTHANCIVYRFYQWEQPAVCFVWRLLPFHFFCPDVIICGTAASLVNISDSHLLICFSLSLFRSRFTATPTWPPTVSTIFTHGKCFYSPLQLLWGNLSSGGKKPTCHQWKTQLCPPPRYYTDTVNKG